MKTGVIVASVPPRVSTLCVCVLFIFQVFHMQRPSRERGNVISPIFQMKKLKFFPKVIQLESVTQDCLAPKPTLLTTTGTSFTFTFHFQALEKEMAAHSSVLAWRIPGMGEPGGLPSIGSHRVGHD